MGGSCYLARMGRRTPLHALLALAACALGSVALSSCSDPVDDSLGRACKVIVGCGVDVTHGDCIDTLGYETSECIACVEHGKCDYVSCERDVAGCRIPDSLIPP
jgi:hypothetical protein